MKDDLDDVDVQDVEALLRQMSLKEPGPVRVETNAMTERRGPGGVRLREILIAISCLFAGVLLGRLDLAADPFGELLDKSQVVASVDSSKLNSNNDRVANAQEPSVVSEVQLIDKGLFLVNGKVPVRKYESVSKKKVMVVDPVSGLQKPVLVPVKEVFMMAAPSI